MYCMMRLGASNGYPALVPMVLCFFYLFVECFVVDSTAYIVKQVYFVRYDPFLLWQLKEEEVKKLRASLEQQKQEIKKREEEMQTQALDKVL